MLEVGAKQDMMNAAQQIKWKSKFGDGCDRYYVWKKMKASQWRIVGENGEEMGKTFKDWMPVVGEGRICRT